MEQVSSRKVIWDRGKQLSHSMVSMVCGEKGLQADATLGCGFPAFPVKHTSLIHGYTQTQQSMQEKDS